MSPSLRIVTPLPPSYTAELCVIDALRWELVVKPLLCLLMLCGLLQACGQKGPLYLPQSDKPNADQPAQQAPVDDDF